MKLEISGRRAIVTGDLADRAAVRTAVQQAADALGGIDILVNCAGGVRGQVGRPLEEVGEQDWMVLFEANVHGPFWSSQAVAPHMKRGGYGRIVNIASGAGLRPSLTGIHTRRLGRPQDIADAVMFLASGAASWISGQILSVDGGRS